MLHVWYFYLQNWVILRVNVGKYSIHGAFGYGNLYTVDVSWCPVRTGEPAKSPPRPGDAGDASGGSNQSNHSTGDAGTGDGALDELEMVSVVNVNPGLINHGGTPPIVII
jgi:hypothetical protein